MEILALLKENSETIYEIISKLKKHKKEDALKSVVKQVYINRFDIIDGELKEQFVRNISIYSTILTLDINERKEVLNKLGIKKNIDIKDEDHIYEIIKENYEKLTIDKETIIIPKDLNEVIENCFYKIKKTAYKNSTRYIIALSTFAIFVSFISLPHYAYIFTPFGNVFNSIHNKLFVTEYIQVKPITTVVDINSIESKQDAIELIHSMSNMMVIADNNNIIEEFTDVNPITVDIAMQGIKDYVKDKKLENMLLKWKKGDFSNATKVHNYIWSMLDREEGYAIAIDKYVVNEILENHSY